MNNVYNIPYILQKTRPKFETTSFSEDMNLLSKPEHFIICDRLLETEHVLNIQNTFIEESSMICSKSKMRDLVTS